MKTKDKEGNLKSIYRGKITFQRITIRVSALVPGHFHQLKRNPQSFPILSFPCPQETTNVISISMALPILDISYK